MKIQEYDPELAEYIQAEENRQKNTINLIPSENQTSQAVREANASVLMNKYSEGYDKIATGHNLDDESQAVLMNLLKAQKKLFNRQGPKTKKIKGFTQKIKPLYFLKEKEIMVYAFIKKLNVSFTECPFATLSYRSKVRDALNEYESKNPGTKENILRKYLSIRSFDDQEINICMKCGSPCSGIECKACRIRQRIASEA